LDEFYPIAKIISAGKNGFLKIQNISSISEKFEKIKTVYLDFWNQKKQFEIEEVLIGKNAVFLKFVNFDDDREISLLINREIFVSDSDAEKFNLKILLEQTLIGFNIYRGKEYLGLVNDFFETPANQVIEIKNPEGKEILIPFVHSIFDKIDYKSKELVLKSDYGIEDDET
jgi:16S rRNA processing protein RimM